MTLEGLRLRLAECIRGTEFAGRTWFAGGCVRDELLGLQQRLQDADLAVELPEGGLRLAKLLRDRLPTPEPDMEQGFGTASARFGELRLDYVMTRSEAYCAGSRHPRVRFAPLAKDCQRRDFTINALYLEIMEGGVIDPCGRGLYDLRQKILRCVQDPQKSMLEDPLRILRALRFAVLLDLEIEAETISAIEANAPLCATLSRRRCRDELQKLRSAASPAAYARWLSMLEDTGVLPYLSLRVELPRG